MTSPHSHDSNPSAASRNRTYFSSPDQIYLREKPFLDAFAAEWTKEFLANESWLALTNPSSTSTSSSSSINDSEGLRMLDYASGVGMLSFAALQLSSTPRFTTILGVDIADGMVRLFNERVREACSSGTIDAETVTIWSYRGDLVSPSTPSSSSNTPGSSTTTTIQNGDDTSLIPELLPSLLSPGFHLVTTSMALHHFEDPVLAVRKLSERLLPGGTLFVADLVPGSVEGSEDVWLGRREVASVGHGHSHSHSHGHGHEHPPQHGHGHGKEDTGVVHHGFTKNIIEDMFTQTGLVDVRTRMMDLVMQMPGSFGGDSKRMFWVVGKKPAN